MRCTKSIEEKISTAVRRQRAARVMDIGQIFVRTSWLVAAVLFLMTGAARTGSAANNCVQGGKVYNNCTLDDNYVGTITIAGSSITLDCGMFPVSGPGANGNAINIINVRDVTVKNCVVQNGATGINIENSRYVKLVNDHVKLNRGTGVKITNSADVSLSNCDVSRNNNDDGVDVNHSYNITIQGGSISRNGDEGIDLDFADNVSISNVNMTMNGVNTDMGGDGINVNSSNYVSILNCDIGESRGFGVDIQDSFRVTVQHNFLDNNSKGPIRAKSSTHLVLSPNP